MPRSQVVVQPLQINDNSYDIKAEQVMFSIGLVGVHLTPN